MIPTDPWSLLALAALVLAAAVLYSSVGHAGASGYLAAMALFGVAPEVMKPAALVMNLGVALVGTARFARARLIRWRLFAPLAIGSVPAAFAGGFLTLPTRAHRILLGVVLVYAAVRLGLVERGDRPTRPAPGPWSLCAMGSLMGLVAGLTGVGGGIFLSPLLILTGWEETRRTAGLSAVFILANSIAGLLGHLQAGRGVPSGTLTLTFVALAGGFYGSSLAVRQLSTAALRKLLAVVLVVAGGKLLLTL